MPIESTAGCLENVASLFCRKAVEKNGEPPPKITSSKPSALISPTATEGPNCVNLWGSIF